MFDWLFGRELKKVLNETKKIKVLGIRFTIKKVNLLNYLDGSKVLIQAYDTHKTAGQKAVSNPSFSEDKIKRHYADIFLAGVVTPQLAATKELAEKEKRVFVGDLFVDWNLATELYVQIMTLTYGKKKVKQAMSHVKELTN